MTSITEETGAATATATAQPKPTKKARVAPPRAHVTPKKNHEHRLDLAEQSRHRRLVGRVATQ